MPTFRGWAIMPKAGTGDRDDAIRPAFDLSHQSDGDRTEHIIGGQTRCLVAVDVSDDALLAGGVLLADHADIGKAFSALPPAARNRISTALANLGETDTSGTLRDVLRRAGRRLDANFDPLRHLTSGAPTTPGSFVNDTFTDTAGTSVLTHTGETGATWTKHPSYSASGAVISDANRLRASLSTDWNIFYSSGVPAGAEYDVTSVIYIATYTSSFAAATGRHSTSADTYYMARNPGAGAWNLQKSVAGTVSTLGTFSQTLSAGVSYTVQIQIRDATKKMFIDGVERASSSDNAITAAGRVGAIVVTAGSNTTHHHLDSVTGTDFVPGTSLVVPPAPLRALIGR